MQLLYDTCYEIHVYVFKNIKFYKGERMNQQEIEKLDELTLDLNMDLCVLKSAVISNSEDLEVSDLTNITERMYKISSEIRDIFYDS